MKCKVDECPKPGKRRKMCYAHYERWKQYGDPRGGREPLRGSKPWDRVKWYGWKVTEYGCWEYCGGRDKNGYGKVKAAGNLSLRAHRVSWEHHAARPVPDGAMILHSCDNPPCINPEHLRPGSAAENSNDKILRGRSMRGELNPRARLTKADVVEILENPDLSIAALARKHGVTEGTVAHVRHRRSWIDVIEQWERVYGRGNVGTDEEG